MPKIRNIIIFAAIAVALILVYFLFIRKPAPQNDLVSSPVTTAVPGTTSSVESTDATTQVAQDFLSLLLSVKSIKLNDSIFSDPAFNGLHDSTIILVPDAVVGRPNPFAQFGNDITPVVPVTPVNQGTNSTTSSTSTQVKP